MIKRIGLAATVIAGLMASVVGGNIANAAPGRALSGTINVAGSTALLPLVNQAAQDFMAKNPGVTVQVAGGGSGTGLAQAQSGAIDIGDSDIYADPAKQPDLVDHQVAVVAFVLTLNKSVNLTNLTQKQLQNIYTASYTSKDRVENWKQIGGPDLKVVTIVRPLSSGTRKTFDKIVLKGGNEKGTTALQKDSTNLVLTTVAQYKGAVGYAALGSAQSAQYKGKLSIVSYNGVAPTKANIVTGKYEIVAYEHMYTKGKPNTLAQAFIDYVSSPDVQKNVAEAKLGFIPLNEMKVTIPKR